MGCDAPFSNNTLMEPCQCRLPTKIKQASFNQQLNKQKNMQETNQQYKKAKDYGTSWRIFRLLSLADQIMIKALRIRNLQMQVQNKVGDNIADEFKGIVNYGLISLIQMEMAEPSLEDLPLQQVAHLYNNKVAATFDVMQLKNHDYGEAWRDMSQESFADLILVKLHRIRQILSNDGKTLVSEGIDSNFIDIINYAIFALILIEEGKHKG
jgi:hypothetical protein